MKSHKTATKQANLQNILSNLIPQYLFEYIDTDKSGSISRTEFQTFIKNAYLQKGLHVPDMEEVNKTFNEIDVDKNGIVSIDELKKWFYRQKGQGNVAEFANHIAFEKLDKNKNNYISSGDFVEELQNYSRFSNLGDISDDVIRGPYYESLIPGHTHFRERHFDRLVDKILYEPKRKADSRAHEIAASSEWSRTSFHYILRQMLVNNFFNAIDADHNGKITNYEMSNFYKQFAYSHGWDAPIDSDIKYLYNLMDLNRDGLITVNEVSSYLENAIQSGSNIKLFAQIASTITFERLDEDKSGSLSLDELYNGISKYARANQFLSPEKDEVQEAYKSVSSGVNFGLMHFEQMVSNSLLRGVSFNSSQNPSGPAKLRIILTSLLTERFFNSIDTTRKGSFGYYDFSGYLLKTARRFVLNVPSSNLMRKIFSDIDTTKRGSVTLNEVKLYISDKLISGSELNQFIELISATAFGLLNKSGSGDLSIEEWRSGIKSWAFEHGIEIPSDEILNEAWRHAIGVANSFNVYSFINLIGVKFGLSNGTAAQARLI